jgi:hypothetical protein
VGVKEPTEHLLEQGNQLRAKLQVAIPSTDLSSHGSLHGRSLSSRKVSSYGNTNTLDNGKQQTTRNGTISSVSPATSEGKSTTGHETSDDRVERILLSSNGLDGTIHGRENTTPSTEVTSNNRSSHSNGREGTCSSLTKGRVSETLDTVPDSTSDNLLLVMEHCGIMTLTPPVAVEYSVYSHP